MAVFARPVWPDFVNAEITPLKGAVSMKKTGYIYTIVEDKEFQTRIFNAEFENEWMRLKIDGSLLVKGSHYKGYAWNGCSPKIQFLDTAIGTPEGVLNPDTLVSKTYYPSLVHDVFYQFSFHYKNRIKRGDVDQEFYRMLKAEHFKAADIYYGAVRFLGSFFWGRQKQASIARKL